MKTATVLTLAILAQATGNIYLSKGMRHIASANQMGSGVSPLVLLQVMESPMIWGGTALLLIFFLLYAAALSWADLSFVLPATSFGYVVNVAFAYYFLNEPVSPVRWTGTALICIGVILVSRSGTRTANPEPPAGAILVGGDR